MSLYAQMIVLGLLSMLGWAIVIILLLGGYRLLGGGCL